MTEIIEITNAKLGNLLNNVPNTIRRKFGYFTFIWEGVNEGTFRQDYTGKCFDYYADLDDKHEDGFPKISFYPAE